MLTRANTKAVNHWFLMLFIVLSFLYFIGCVLGLGTELERSPLLSFFCCYNSCQTYFGSPKKFMGESFTNDFIILQQSFRNSSNILLTYISPYCL